jgi:hypothetical protein
VEKGEQAVGLRMAPRVGEEEPEVSHRGRRLVAAAGGDWRGLGGLVGGGEGRKWGRVLPVGRGRWAGSSSSAFVVS